MGTKIAPPTSRSQADIEADLQAFVRNVSTYPETNWYDSASRQFASFDPCISCATHFLDLTMEES